MSIDYKQVGKVGVLTLNRPEKRNALDPAARQEMEERLNHVAQRDDVNCLLIRAEGDSFCAGGDLATLGHATNSWSMHRRLRQQHRVTRALYDLPVPVVASVQGAAYGAGCNLALLADVILATEDAVFCQSYMRIGMVPDGAGMYLLAQSVGVQRAKRMVFFGEPLTAGEAESIGLVQEVYADRDTLEYEALQLSKRLADGPTSAYGFAKSLIGKSVNVGFDEFLEMEATAESLLVDTDYHRSAVSNLLQRIPD